MIKNNNFYFLIAVIILTIITFSPTLENGFTNWDDHLQITENPQVKELSIQNVTTIFSSFYVGMYQPLTTLFFTVEHYFFGLNAKGFHAVSLFFHIINILLVFWLIKLLTKRNDISILITSLFAVHPMFVEAVAWVSARSTLMYASFYLAAIISYLYYLKEYKIKYFFIALAFFLFSLLAKVMAITLPILLILFDFYYQRKVFSKRIIFEKIPFFILTFIFGIIAVYGREVEGHLSADFTFWDKPFLISYQILWYFFKFILPINLSAFYPNTEKINGFLPFVYYISPIILLTFSFIVFKFKKNRKTIAFYFAFFLINISLVLKIIQVGKQLVTDRYTYIAYIGFLLLIGLFYKLILEKKPKLKSILNTLVLSIVLVFSYSSYQRTKVWQSSKTLWSDVVLKNDKIALAQTNLGVTYVGTDNLKAEKYFLKSIELDSTFVIPYNNIGFLYLEKDRKKAEKYLFKAIEVDASYLYIYTNLASLYMKTDKLKAQKYILKAQAINPKNKYVLQRINSFNKQWIN